MSVQPRVEHMPAPTPAVTSSMELHERSTEVFSEDADRILNKLRENDAMAIVIDSNLKVIKKCDDFLENTEEPDDPYMQKGYWRSLNRLVQNANNAKKLLVSLFVPMVAIKAKTVEKDGSMAINMHDLEKTVPPADRMLMRGICERLIESKGDK